MKKLILIAALAATACNDLAAPDNDASLTTRFAKPSAPPPPSGSITVQVLGSLPYSGSVSGGAIGMALNNGATRSLTRVAGHTPYQQIAEYPFTWTAASGMRPLRVIDPGYGWPMGVSDNGIIVGEMALFGGLGNRAFTVTADGPMTYLPVPSDASYSRASGISADGRCISGFFSNGTSSFAVVWMNGVLDTVGTGGASGITNDCMTVSGNSTGGATVWRLNGSTWVPEQLPGIRTETTDISPNGEYVSGTRRDSVQMYAQVWRFNGTQWVATDLPNSNFYAFGVSNNGRAVGTSTNGEPILWTRSSTGTYTGQILPPPERNMAGWANAINELGQISGRARTRDGWRAVMWTVN